jgi:hypothetical protein
MDPFEAIPVIAQQCIKLIIYLKHQWFINIFKNFLNCIDFSKLNLIKGQYHKIFNPCFFQQLTHPRALIHGLKLFHIWLRICQEIWYIHLKWSASAVYMRPWKPLPRFDETAEAASVVSMWPQKPLPRFQWDCGSWFGSFIETAEAASTVSMRLRKLIWRFHWDHGSSFHGFNEAAEAALAVSVRLRNPYKIFSNIIFPRKGSFQHKTMLKTVWLWRDRRSGFSGLNETAEAAKL